MSRNSKSSKLPRYRGPLYRWEIIKHRLSLVVFGLFIAFTSYTVIAAVLTGRIPVLRKHSHDVVTWVDSPWRFLAWFTVWTIVGALSAGGFVLLSARLRDLQRQVPD